MSETDYANCWSKALELLARRSHFKLELRRKLERREFSSLVIQQVVDKLETKDYLNDYRVAVEFARLGIERKHWGPVRLRAELQQRGVEGGAVHDVLASLVKDDGLANAVTAAEKWRRRRPSKGREALLSHLQRKGYSLTVSLSAADSDESSGE